MIVTPRTLGRRRCVVSLAAVAFSCTGGREIMTFEAYAEVSHPVPFVREFRLGKGRLFYFGSAHTYEPSNPQVATIMRYWDAFGATVALNEGGDPPVEASVGLAVTHYGESGLVRFLANRDNVVVRSLEPSLPKQVEDLKMQGYSTEEIKLYFVLRQIPQIRVSSGRPSRDELEKTVAYFTSQAGLPGAPETVPDLEKMIAEKVDAATAWEDVPQSWFDPVFDRPPTYLNEVSRALSEARDAAIVQTLYDYVRQGHRVFAVMGASHVVMQEPALRRMLRPSRI